MSQADSGRPYCVKSDLYFIGVNQGIKVLAKSTRNRLQIRSAEGQKTCGPLTRDEREPPVHCSRTLLTIGQSVDNLDIEDTNHLYTSTTRSPSLSSAAVRIGTLALPKQRRI